MKKTNNWLVISGVIAIICVFVALSLLSIDKAIWFDESYSAYLIRGDFSEIWNLTAVDVHPPLYYFCLKIWSLMFGYSVVSLRMMSVFFGVVAIILTYFLVKKLFDRKTALVAILFMAVAPFMVRYSEEMRMYTMILAIVMGASLVLIWAIEKGGWWRYVIYGVMLALGVWTHYFTVLAWIVQLGYLIYVKRKEVLHWEVWVGYVVAVGLFLPWVPVFLKQFFNVSGGFWVEAVSFKTIANYFVEGAFCIGDSGWTNGWLAILLVAFLVFTIVCLIRVLKADKKLILLVGLALMPPILLYLLSLPPLTPLFVSRYVVYAVILIWVINGIAFVKDKSWMRWGLMSLTLAVTMVGLVSVFVGSNSEVKAMVFEVIERADEGEKIVAGTDGIYYDSIMYNSSRNEIWGIDEKYGSSWEPYEPIEHYRYHLVDKTSDLEDEQYWLIVKRDNVLDIPEGYIVLEEFYNQSGNLRAVEFMKSSL